MVKAADALASHARAIAEIGEDVIVRRYSGTGPTRTKNDVTAKARVMGYRPHEILGAVQEGDRRVIMLVDALGGLLPLTPADKLVIRGRECAIKSVDDSTRRIAGELVALEIHAAG